jgi:voltage-gated potassium channel
VPVLCAAHEHCAHARMAASGAEEIINPYDTFAERVALSIRTPSLHVIYESLTTQRGTAMDEPQRLPRGRWVLCGFDLFARTLRRQLERLQIETFIVDVDLDETCDSSNSLRGDPTDPAVLRRANIEDATALVAGTAVDIDNLAITLAARALNKHLFLVARQTQRRNGSVFRASPADMVMLSGYIIAAEVLRVIRTPQLATFLRGARDEDEAWAAALLHRMRDVIGADIVESWSIELTPDHAVTACTAIERGETVTLGRLMLRAESRGEPAYAVPLLLQRGQDRILLPASDLSLEIGDRVLCCGRARARSIMRGNVIAHTLPAFDSVGAYGDHASPIPA